MVYVIIIVIVIITITIIIVIVIIIIIIVVIIVIIIITISIIVVSIGEFFMGIDFLQDVNFILFIMVITKVFVIKHFLYLVFIVMRAS